MFLFAVAVTSLSPALPAIAAEFGAGLGRLGLIFTSNFLGFCAALSFSGCFSGRIPKSRFFVAGGLGLGLALAAMSAVPGLNFAYAAIFFVGGFGGLVESIGSAVAADLNPGRVGPALNLAQVFFALGALAGPMLTSAFIARGISWRLMYLGTGAVTLALFLPFLFARFPDPPEERFSWPALRGLARDGWFLGVLLVMAAYVGVEIGLWGWLATYLGRDLGFSVVRSGWAVSLFWLAMTAGRGVCSALLRRVPASRVLIGLTTLGLAATVPLVLPAARLPIWPIVVLLGLGLSGIWPTIVAYGSARHPGHRVLVFSAIVASGGLGGLVVPALVGALAEAAGFRSGLFLLVLLQAAMLGGLVLLGRRRA